MSAETFAIRDTADTFPADTPPRLSPDGNRLAFLRPTHHQQQEETVELLARTTRGLIVVRVVPDPTRRDGKAGKRPVYSVYHIRLVDAATRRKLLRADFTYLPWNGTGPDPDAPKPEPDEVTA